MPSLGIKSKVYLFFLSWCFFSDTDDSQDSRWLEGTIFYSTLPLPPAHEHWEIYLQLCMSDDYHVFLIATFVFTRLLLDEIYHLIELPFDWLIDDAMFVCLLHELILGFCYSDLIWETGGFELISTITLVLQANPLTKCVSHPEVSFQWWRELPQKYQKQPKMSRTTNQVLSTKQPNFLPQSKILFKSHEVLWEGF